MTGPAALPAPAPPTADVENPWPGLLAFREVDQEFFRGRRSEAAALFRIVMRERLVVLFGLSGLGKSSLLQAGLFPLLRREDVFPVYIRLDFSLPEPDLVGQVRSAISRDAEAAEIEAPRTAPNRSLWEYFHQKENDFWNSRNKPVVPLLVFDQFEEIFTLGRNGQGRIRATEILIDELGDLSEGRPPAELKARVDDHPESAKAFSFTVHDYKLLLSLREDFLPELETLRSRIPAIGLNRFRLQRMNGAAALEVVNQAPQLVSEDVAERIVRFVATVETGVELASLEVEPALLSVICRELNEKRKAAGEERITAAVLEGSQEQILTDFYERSIHDLGPPVRKFVEDSLLTIDGYRDSVAVENALAKVPGLTREAIDTLVARRLVRREERAGVERLELTHDRLSGVVRASRDRRHAIEAAEEERRKERLVLEEARERERRERDRRELKRIRIAAAVFLLMTLVAVGAAVSAWQLRSAADKARTAAERASAAAEAASKQETVQRERAEQALQMIQRSQQIRQAALSFDEASLSKLLGSLQHNITIRFRVEARDLGYRNQQGQQVYDFRLRPDPASLPAGDNAVAFVTYLANHPTFRNTLMTAGPDRRFEASYIGWGCLRRVVALVEYKDPLKQATVAEFDMCEQLGW